VVATTILVRVVYNTSRTLGMGLVRAAEERRQSGAVNYRREPTLSGRWDMTNIQIGDTVGP
jgi:hypothetical protein